MEADILTNFSTLDDPRVECTKLYPLMEIIFLVMSAALSGCAGWKSIKDFGDIKLAWLRQFLPYKNRLPVDDTIARVMRRLDPNNSKHVLLIGCEESPWLLMEL